MENIEISEEEKNLVLGANPKLAMQSFETLKGEMSPLTFETMSRQATTNIGID